AGDPASYPTRLAAHPVIGDYRRVFRLRQAATGFVRPTSPAGDAGAPPRSRARRLLSAPRVRGRAVATGFAWMFSGARLPAPKLIDLALTVGESWGRRNRQARAA